MRIQTNFMWICGLIGCLLVSMAVSQATTPPTTSSSDGVLEADDDVMCDPQLADSCFTDVQDDLRKIFRPDSNYVTLLVDLCSAWNDSLQCTSDIIDTGCKEEDGRLRFDHWLTALSKTRDFVCSGDMQILKDLFASANCLNVTSLFYCVETTANLGQVGGLMATDLDATECKYLKAVVDKCGEYVTKGTCAMNTLEPLNTVTDVFFSYADCTPKRSASTSATYRPNTNQIAVALLTVITTLFRHVN